MSLSWMTRSIGSFGITPRSGGLANLADVNRQLLQDCRENGETVDQARARWAWAEATIKEA